VGGKTGKPPRAGRYISDSIPYFNNYATTKKAATNWGKVAAQKINRLLHTQRITSLQALLNIFDIPPHYSQP
jgi:hypothetical protein